MQHFRRSSVSSVMSKIDQPKFDIFEKHISLLALQKLIK